MINRPDSLNQGLFLQERSLSRHYSTGSANKLYRPEFETKGQSEEQTEKIWALMAEYLTADAETIQKNVVHHLEHTLAHTRFASNRVSFYRAAAYSIRDRLIESWNDTQQYMNQQDPKRVYYFSLEFLMGRAMRNALINMDIEQNYKEALEELGVRLEDLYEEEQDPGLGNGGLGRLAACFLDSLATLNYPAWGYGIRYNYGIFKQLIIDCGQTEVPDYWLEDENPWEIKRHDVRVPIRFYGQVTRRWIEGVEKSKWENGEVVLAEAHDYPIPGYGTFNTINLRLWKSIPTSEFDFSSFNQGDYFKALEKRHQAEFISSVLYPNDSTPSGKELRLKQQYFFVSASLHDILRRFKKKKRDWNELPKKVAVQLNDTHPALAIIELMRILIDYENFSMEEAWGIVYKTCAYTNHTVMTEALERWNVELFERLLPRHLEIIYAVNFHFLKKVSDKYPDDYKKLTSLSIIEEGPVKKVRMANLSIVGSHAVNGVAAIHSQILKDDLFKDFYQMFPKKFQNKTNGVTPRRWLVGCNPELSKLYSENLQNDDWKIDLDQIAKLKSLATDADFQKKWYDIKLANKRRLANWIFKVCKVHLNENSLFDVMVKRIHEYKRQLMNAFYVIHRYLAIKATAPEERRKKFVPRSILIGGKAAPGYVNAKKIIRLIGAISKVVNDDPDVGDLLKVVFMPNYSVSFAEIIIPASEISQHISTAGTEASGTSNMKFCLNGCLIIGTMDGANVEIAEEIGQENMFIFGCTVTEVDKLREQMRAAAPKDYIGETLMKVFEAIREGMFGFKEELSSLVDTLANNNDYYLLCNDFVSYLQAQEKVDENYRNRSDWIKKSILTATGTAKFSSDRTIKQYAQEIWNLEPVNIPKPSLKPDERMRSKILDQ